MSLITILALTSNTKLLDNQTYLCYLPVLYILTIPVSLLVVFVHLQPRHVRNKRLTILLIPYVWLMQSISIELIDKRVVNCNIKVESTPRSLIERPGFDDQKCGQIMCCDLSYVVDGIGKMNSKRPSQVNLFVHAVLQRLTVKFPRKERFFRVSSVSRNAETRSA